MVSFKGDQLSLRKLHWDVGFLTSQLVPVHLAMESTGVTAASQLPSVRDRLGLLQLFRHQDCLGVGYWKLALGQRSKEPLNVFLRLKFVLVMTDISPLLSGASILVIFSVFYSHAMENFAQNTVKEPAQPICMKTGYPWSTAQVKLHAERVREVRNS